MGGNPDNVLSAITRGAKLGLINKPKPHRKKLLYEGTNKPILDERTGKPKYISRLFTSKTDRWNELATLREYIQPELLRAHGGHHPKKPKDPIPTCPHCHEPATKEHTELECANKHKWNVNRTFEAESDDVKPQDDNSLSDQELAAIFDGVDEALSETASCPSIEDIGPQDDISDEDEPITPPLLLWTVTPSL
jgi:hypothetical protein